MFLIFITIILTVLCAGIAAVETAAHDFSTAAWFFFCTLSTGWCLAWMLDERFKK